MSQAILLGAGASVDARVPAAIAMTNRISETFGQLGVEVPVCEAYDVVVARLRESWGEINVNVEVVYQALVGLSTRAAGPQGVFVNSWSDDVSRLDPAFTDLVKGHRYPDPRQSEGSVFSRAAAAMRWALTFLTYLDDAALVGYYDSLVKAAHVAAVPIFTLNYDNAVELACGAEVPFDYGLNDWLKKGMVSFDANKLKLVKLHGSVTWAAELSDPYYGIQVYGDPARPFEQMELMRSGNVYPYVVFGAGNKLTAENFMLELMTELPRTLSQTEVLHVVGYGFADEHINHHILRWKERGGELRVYDFKSESDFRNELAIKPLGAEILPFKSPNPDMVIRGDCAAKEAFEKYIVPSILRKW